MVPTYFSVIVLMSLKLSTVGHPNVTLCVVVAQNYRKILASLEMNWGNAIIIHWENIF